MTPEQRARAIVGLNSIAEQSRAARNMPSKVKAVSGMFGGGGGPTLAELLTGNAERRGLLDAPIVRATHPRLGASNAMETQSGNPSRESWARAISRWAGNGSNYTGDAASVAALVGLFPPAAPVLEPIAGGLGIVSGALTGVQTAADLWTAATEGDSYPLAVDLPGALIGQLAGPGATAILKGDGRILTRAEKAFLNAGTNGAGQAASASVPPDSRLGARRR